MWLKIHPGYPILQYYGFSWIGYTVSCVSNITYVFRIHIRATYISFCVSLISNTSLAWLETYWGFNINLSKTYTTKSLNKTSSKMYIAFHGFITNSNVIQLQQSNLNIRLQFMKTSQKLNKTSHKKKGTKNQHSWIEIWLIRNKKLGKLLSFNNYLTTNERTQGVVRASLTYKNAKGDISNKWSRKEYTTNNLTCTTTSLLCFWYSLRNALEVSVKQ